MKPTAEYIIKYGELGRDGAYLSSAMRPEPTVQLFERFSDRSDVC